MRATLHSARSSNEPAEVQQCRRRGQLPTSPSSAIVDMPLPGQRRDVGAALRSLASRRSHGSVDGPSADVQSDLPVLAPSRPGTVPDNSARCPALLLTSGQNGPSLKQFFLTDPRSIHSLSSRGGSTLPRPAQSSPLPLPRAAPLAFPEALENDDRGGDAPPRADPTATWEWCTEDDEAELLLDPHQRDAPRLSRMAHIANNLCDSLFSLEQRMSGQKRTPADHSQPPPTGSHRGGSRPATKKSAAADVGRPDSAAAVDGAQVLLHAALSTLQQQQRDMTAWRQSVLDGPPGGQGAEPSTAAASAAVSQPNLLAGGDRDRHSKGLPSARPNRTPREDTSVIPFARLSMSDRLVSAVSGRGVHREVHERLVECKRLVEEQAAAEDRAWKQRQATLRQEKAPLEDEASRLSTARSPEFRTLDAALRQLQPGAAKAAMAARARKSPLRDTSPADDSDEGGGARCNSSSQHGVTSTTPAGGGALKPMQPYLPRTDTASVRERRVRQANEERAKLVEDLRKKRDDIQASGVHTITSVKYFSTWIAVVASGKVFADVIASQWAPFDEARRQNAIFHPPHGEMRIRELTEAQLLINKHLFAFRMKRRIQRKRGAVTILVGWLRVAQKELRIRFAIHSFTKRVRAIQRAFRRFRVCRAQRCIIWEKQWLKEEQTLLRLMALRRDDEVTDSLNLAKMDKGLAVAFGLIKGAPGQPAVGAGLSITANNTDGSQPTAAPESVAVFFSRRDLAKLKAKIKELKQLEGDELFMQDFVHHFDKCRVLGPTSVDKVRHILVDVFREREQIYLRQYSNYLSQKRVATERQVWVNNAFFAAKATSNVSGTTIGGSVVAVGRRGAAGRHAVNGTTPSTSVPGVGAGTPLQRSTDGSVFPSGGKLPTARQPSTVAAVKRRPSVILVAPGGGGPPAAGGAASPGPSSGGAAMPPFPTLPLFLRRLDLLPLILSAQRENDKGPGGLNGGPTLDTTSTFAAIEDDDDPSNGAASSDGSKKASRRKRRGSVRQIPDGGDGSSKSSSFAARRGSVRR